MDENRFDHLARSLSLAAGRRGTLRLLAALSLTGVLAAFGGDADEAEARAEIGGRGYHDRRLRRRRRARRRHNQDNDKNKNNKKQKHRRRNRRRRGDETAPEPCTPECAGKSCGPDGCGGACGPGCPVTAPNCTAQGQCAPPSCSDGVQNGNETDTDCGGSCPPCAEGQSCVANTDCQAPATCGGAGSPGICGQACVPNICAEVGATCGVIGDGCGGFLNCGLCPPDKVCGAPGAPNICSDCDPDPRCSRAQPRGVVLPCCGINP